MTKEEFEYLADWIEREARYAANEVMNRNDCSDSLSRAAYRDAAQTALVTES